MEVNLRSRFNGDTRKIKAYNTDKLCSELPALDKSPDPSLLPENMADDFQGGTVDILIGVDHMYDIILWDQIEINDRLLAVETVFGYVLHGQQDCNFGGQTQRSSYHSHSVVRMWDLDTVGTVHEEEEKRTDTKFPPPKLNERENRSEMGLTWSSDQRPVSNFQSAKARVQRMERAVTREITEKYEAKLAEMEENAVIEPAEGLKMTNSRDELTHRQGGEPSSSHASTEPDPGRDEQGGDDCGLKPQTSSSCSFVPGGTGPVPTPHQQHQDHHAVDHQQHSIQSHLDG